VESQVIDSLIDGDSGQDIRIALDDRLTDYSGLAALDWFAFDRMKIDGDVLRCVPKSNQTAAILRRLVGVNGAGHR
jgi:EAL domain-containing protein (putative c-di-GMP-specific phosphodiesterase class I)